MTRALGSSGDAVASKNLVARELVELEGHIVDSLTLSKVLDHVLSSGADYELVSVDIGRTSIEPSRARIELRAEDESALERLLGELQIYGVNRVVIGDALIETADAAGVLPANFYSTTNLPTSVSIDGRWREVRNPEMDCSLVIRESGVIETVPMHRVQRGDRIVVGSDGIRVASPPRKEQGSPFEFMDSKVSSEKPKAMLVAQVAARVREQKANGGRLLVVCGPAVIHTGAGPSVAQLIRDGWIDVLFAGNGFAAHDLESNVYGTSLGVPLREDLRSGADHANHLRVINEIRRHGSIEAAVTAGYITGGAMFECVETGIPYVLAGSIRDDGPLPDVITDTVAATDAMRACLDEVRIALVLASTLHAIATGNLLAATVETYCVDINQAVVTKLSDRGSHQAFGIVTDVGLFVRVLAEHLSSTPQ